MLQTVKTRSAKNTDLPAIAKLHAEVFGPGRFTRSAYRIREEQSLLSRYCRVADLDGDLIAAVRITEVEIGGVAGAALLGPLAVHPHFKGKGFGRRLVSESLKDMRSSGIKLVVLVGDEPYYGKLGFAPVEPAQILLPGPVNPSRILAAELEPGALQHYRGLITPRADTDTGNG